MNGLHALPLDLGQPAPERERRDLSAARGVIWGAALGGVLWVLLAAWLLG